MHTQVPTWLLMFIAVAGMVFCAYRKKMLERRAFKRVCGVCGRKFFGKRCSCWR